MARNHTQVVCSQKQCFYHSSCRETSKKHLWEHLLFIGLLNRTVCLSNRHLDVLKIEKSCWDLTLHYTYQSNRFYHALPHIINFIQLNISSDWLQYQYVHSVLVKIHFSHWFKYYGSPWEFYSVRWQNGRVTSEWKLWPWLSLCYAHFLALKIRIAEQPILCFEQILSLKITCDVSLYFIHHKYYQN